MANEWTYGSEVDLTNGGGDDLTGALILSALPAALFEIEIFMTDVSWASNNTEVVLQLGDSNEVYNTGYESAAVNGSTPSGNETTGITSALASATDAGDVTTGMFRVYRWCDGGLRWLVDYFGLEHSTGLRYAFGGRALVSEITQIKITSPGEVALIDGGVAIGRYR